MPARPPKAPTTEGSFPKGLVSGHCPWGLVYWLALAMLRRLLAQIYDWLSPSDAAIPADMIFTLAGRPNRKVYALDLYAQGLAPILLLSVGRFEIRRLGQLRLPRPTVDLPSLAAPVPPRQRHYFVALEPGATTPSRIQRGILGTWSEMSALACCLQQRPGVNSLLIISSAFHLRRVRLCARALLPSGLAIRYLAVPQDGLVSPSAWWRDRRTRSDVLKEFPKLLVYRLAVVCKSLHWGRGSQASASRRA